MMLHVQVIKEMKQGVHSLTPQCVYHLIFLFLKPNPFNLTQYHQVLAIACPNPNPKLNVNPLELGRQNR